ncbi:MAG: hypothetical protein OXI87_16875 [Albidovulum sp.]|nr:hypothetical protein [Albidovulum sp.]MDE0531211.1 hypothetical protein [Albidovulum sp.]
MTAPRESLLYTAALYVGTGIQKPDYLATIDADPESPTYSRAISRLGMPGIGDELRQTGWNSCSSCHGDSTRERRYWIVPGVRSSNLHIADCAENPEVPRLHKVIEGAEIKSKTNLSAPHKIHCMGPDIVILMLGDAQGNAPGGLLHLDQNFEIVGRWDEELGNMKFYYDFWFQPRHNVMVSSEWAAPNTFMPRLDLEEVGHLKYGREIRFGIRREIALIAPLSRRGRSRAIGSSIPSRPEFIARIRWRGAQFKHHSLVQEKRGVVSGKDY